jgi:threonine/homoserine/homoserine lactone efflux protein
MAVPFFQAMIAGLALAAPVGPVGLLCIRRTLSKGMVSGLVSGAGAAVADAIYASIAAYSVTIISATLARYTGVLELVGGSLLCIIGAHAIYSHKIIEPRDSKAPKNHLEAFLSTLFLTLTNPATIIGFAALFSAMGLKDEEGSRHGAMLLVSGVFAGSALWWIILSTVMHFIRHLLTEHGQRWINLISGSVLTLLGICVIILWFL